jgi:3-phenylpropionate/trans-cinnamate dioxygenase ferredoxin component
MADFIEIGKTDDLNDGKMKQVNLEGKEILMARVDGKYYATTGRCPHMQGYLAKGKLDGTIITCPVHGSQFDLKSGKVARWVEGKGFISFMGKLMSVIGLAAKKEKPLVIYEIKIDGDRVMAKIP